MDRRTPLYRTYATRLLEPVKQRRRGRLVLVGAALAALLLVAVLLGYGARMTAEAQVAPEPTAAARQTEARDELIGGVAPAAVTPAPAAPAGASAPTSAPQPVLEVAGTGGAGLHLREEPEAQARVIATLPEGAALVAVGLDVAADGYTWRPVRDELGREGWVAAEYLR